MRLAIRLVLTLVVLATAPAFAPAPATAQDLSLRAQGLLDFLFRPPLRREPRYERRYREPQRYREPGRGYFPPPPRRAREPRARPRANAPATARVPARVPEPEIVAVEKLPDAKVILVVGDFMGGGLAEGLEAAYAEDPTLRVVDRTSGSSGFVRDDFYDWQAEIGPILEEQKPDLVAVMIGSNDRQQMVVNGQREEKRSDAWTEAYRERVAAFATTLREYGKPVIWVGVPSFKSSSMSSDMLAFNDIYRQAAEEAGAQFVDIWDGFVDENGSFVTSGPDINGQPARLRAGDGINLTASGKRKVAFYAEKPIARFLEGGSAPAPLGGPIAPGVADDIAPAEIDRTVPVSLAGPDLDGGDELLGGTPNSAGNGERAFLKPLEAKPVPGRADDFRTVKTPAVSEEDAKERASSSARTSAIPAP